MKIFMLLILLFGIVGLEAGELRIVPAEPLVEKIRETADSAIIVLLCRPNEDRTNLEVSKVLKAMEFLKRSKQDRGYSPGQRQECARHGGIQGIRPYCSCEYP